MNIIIFAGGAGTRLWPLSRTATPKQFAPFFEGKSTLQLAIDRVRTFGFDHIYISTNAAYVELVQQQVPELDLSHIFSEPAKRDLTAAIGLALVRLKKQGVSGIIGMLWADHLIDRPEVFREALKTADALVQESPERLVFIGERPRFANHNLGWIHVGPEQTPGARAFLGWKYRPELEVCQTMLTSGEWLWNPGYFVYDMDAILNIYKEQQLEMIEALQEMVGDEEKIATMYPLLPAIHFDNAIAEHVDPTQAIVLSVDMGWSDPGTLYAMKEALAEREEMNVTEGAVLTQDSRDCFVYNQVDGQLVTTVGLDGIMIVNTEDSILVCHRDAVPQIKDLLNRMKTEGYEGRL
ncbi:hypothetical protein COV06_02450 [Candidatus Uhrbacteria bacterium CG10_big_fil_rev_8_21_14_0_10_50_16]|uniref:Uncharacterized protein n=1 Tax=Candidatus Uhrbacteria bacterium CG10_big_fil_rev_8_21_14_0_10_50_16 TaxID=1975039 RepID=A0A2H0RM79_9BACT|nr:MAG: hypothetical protein COV06_02450 [Candidatus Uhrbacteria bacterium CG10_big_fil_rev_8_21_14_0_10_50_16]